MAWGLEAATVSDRGNTAGAARGNTSWERCRAVRTVASMACDAGEAVEVWAMLGLTAKEGREGVSRKQPPPKCPNGHPANGNGNCFHSGCPYHNDRRHEGAPQR